MQELVDSMIQEVRKWIIVLFNCLGDENVPPT